MEQAGQSGKLHEAQSSRGEAQRPLHCLSIQNCPYLGWGDLFFFTRVKLLFKICTTTLIFWITTICPGPNSLRPPNVPPTRVHEPLGASEYSQSLCMLYSFFFYLRFYFSFFSQRPPVHSYVFLVVGPSSCGMWDAASAWLDEPCHVVPRIRAGETLDGRSRACELNHSAMGPAPIQLFNIVF